MRSLAHDLVGQFMLGRSQASVPDGWSARRNGSWVLASHSRLPVVDLVGSDASPLGWLLGYPIHPSGNVLTSRFQIPGLPGGTLGLAQFEEHLYTLGGRFAAVYLGRTQPRVYLDPCGTLAVVFCPEQRLVASSLNLIPPSAGTPEDHDLVRAVGVVERGRWYPFGLTPRRGVERLLPNHALDLETWQPVRHWPSGDLPPTNPDIAGTVAEIACVLETAIGAISRAYPVAMPLTAGRHTRMELACARKHLSGMVFFTIPLPDDLAVLDCTVGRRIAQRFQLNYEPFTWVEPTTHDLDAWDYRTGACVAGRARTTVPTLRQLDSGRGILSAVLGELGGPMSWRGDADPRRAEPLDLLKHCRVLPTPELVARARHWLELVPKRGSYHILDFLRVEQRAGCSIGPELYGYPSPGFHVSPFCHRRIVELTLTLPLEYRKLDQLPRDLIGSRWPELLRFPFNEPLGAKALIPAARRTLRSVARSLLLRRSATMRTGRPARQTTG